MFQMYSKVIQFYIHIFFFRFFSIIDYYKRPVPLLNDNIVPSLFLYFLIFFYNKHIAFIIWNRNVLILQECVYMPWVMARGKAGKGRKYRGLHGWVNDQLENWQELRPSFSWIRKDTRQLGKFLYLSLKWNKETYSAHRVIKIFIIEKIKRLL